MRLVDDVPSWKIKVMNSFLSVDEDVLTTHKLSNFWCGYIEGFLNCSLPLIEELIAELEPEQANKVALPAYQEVSEVTHIEDSVVNEDLFVVTFKPRRFSAALQQVIAAKNLIEHSFLEVAVEHCVAGIIQSKQDLHDDDRWTQGISAMEVSGEIRTALLTASPANSFECSQTVKNLLRPLTQDVATNLFHQTNQFIQGLVQGENRR